VTDLPRFHSGRLGPLDFQTLNEMMRRLDALRPLVETASVKNGSEFSTLGDVLIVQAAETHPAEYPGRFAWNQVIVRGESTPTIPVDGEPDTIATEVDDDWETIEENAQYRYGTVVNEEGDKEIESDSYAISVDPTFEGGYAVSCLPSGELTAPDVICLCRSLPARSVLARSPVSSASSRLVGESFAHERQRRQPDPGAGLQRETDPHQRRADVHAGPHGHPA
jgi:hypothetical protein